MTLFLHYVPLLGRYAFYFIQALFFPILLVGFSPQNLASQQRSNVLLGSGGKESSSQSAVPSKSPFSFLASFTYTQSQDTLMFAQGMYSQIEVGRPIQIKGIEFGVKGRLVLNQNEIDRRYSGLSVSLNKKKEINKDKAKKELASKFSDNPLNSIYENLDYSKVKDSVEYFKPFIETYFSKVLNSYKESIDSTIQAERDSIQIDSIHSTKYNDQYLQLLNWVSTEKQNLQKVNTQKDYMSYLEYLPTSIDAAPYGLDSLLMPILVDSNFVALRKTVSKIYDIKQKSLTELTNRLEQSNNNAKEVVKDVDHLQDTISIADVKNAMKIKSLELGSIVVNDDLGTIASVPINGVKGEWGNRSIAVNLNIGKEGESNRLETSTLQRNVNRHGYDRKLISLKVRTNKKEKSSITYLLNYIEGSRPSMVDEIKIVNKNIVFGVSGRQSLGYGFHVNCDWFLSNTTQNANQTWGTLFQNGQGTFVDRSRTEQLIEYQSLKSKIKIYAGYSQIGSAYQSLGNPFQLTNRKDVKIKYVQKILNNKINISGEARLGLVNSKKTSPTQQQNLFSIDAGWNINKRNRVFGRFQPLTLNQSIGSSTNTVLAKTYILGFTHTHRQKEKSRNYTFQLMNFRQESILTDTIFFTDRLIGHVMYGLSSAKWTANFNSYGSYKKGKIEDGQVLFSIGRQNKVLMYDIGLLALKRPFDHQFSEGINSSLRCKIKERSSFGYNILWVRKNQQITTSLYFYHII